VVSCGLCSHAGKLNPTNGVPANTRNFRRCEKSSPPQRGGIFVEARVAASRTPAGCNIVLHQEKAVALKQIGRLETRDIAAAGVWIPASPFLQICHPAGVGRKSSHQLKSCGYFQNRDWRQIARRSKINNPQLKSCGYFFVITSLASQRQERINAERSACRQITRYQRQRY